MAQWLSNHEIAKQEAIAEMSSHTYYGRGPGDFDIDGKTHTVDDPKGGRVV